MRNKELEETRPEFDKDSIAREITNFRIFHGECRINEGDGYGGECELWEFSNGPYDIHHEIRCMKCGKIVILRGCDG